jgi:inositol-pentakisphosphate 2-kinase
MSVYALPNDYHVENMDGVNWKYLARGSLHIVLRYNGARKEFTNKVLRLRMQTNYPSLHDVKDKHELSNEITSVLLGEQFVPGYSFVALTPAVLAELSNVVANFENPVELDATQPFGLLLDDLVSAHKFAFEIKPKWGFLPASNVHARHNEVKMSTCRYCMHKVYKSQLKGKGIETVGDYCPLNLFSSDGGIVLDSLKALRKYPSNNLSIMNSGVISDDPMTDDQIQKIANIICGSDLLRNLAKQQKRLDSHSIEYVQILYENLSDADFAMINNLNEWRKILYRTKEVSSDMLAPHEIIIEYLIGVALKDLSVIISFDEDDSDAIVKVIDVDVKSVRKIPHWFQLDQKIASAFIEHGGKSSSSHS